MNLFKIVRKRTNKRKDEDSPYRDVGMVLLFVFLLPYVISCLWGHIGEETETLFLQTDKEENRWIDEQYEVTFSGSWGTRQMSMEEYLIQKLMLAMPKNGENHMEYEAEALKAQAVLLRTELWALLDDDEAVVLQDDVTQYDGKDTLTEEEREQYVEAVHGTDGIFLAYEGKPIKAAFFPVSNGRTREAAQVWVNNNYPYLVSVECSQDILAKDYQSQVVLLKKDYCKKIRELFGMDDTDKEFTEQELWNGLELTYDSTDYVTEVKVQEYSCSGEAFRYALGLDSASFEPEWKEQEVIFHVKGVGHGFGMSQYGANVKAASGETFEQILKDYFFQVELVKIE